MSSLPISQGFVVSNDAINARNNLPPALEYGRNETMTIACMHKTKNPDTGNPKIL